MTLICLSLGSDKDICYYPCGNYRDNPFPGAPGTTAKQTSTGLHPTSLGEKQEDTKTSLGNSVKLRLENRVKKRELERWLSGEEHCFSSRDPALIPTWRLTTTQLRPRRSSALCWLP